MWYETEEEAAEAVKWKEKEYGVEFYVLKDGEHPDCWWAQRRIIKDDNT